MSRPYIIYLITNLVNGLIYVGRTTRPLKTRWNAHRGGVRVAKNQRLRLYQAMAEFGVNSFKIEQIDTATSFEELKRKEREHILSRRSHLPEIGYNMAIDTDDGLEFLSQDSIARRRCSIYRTHAQRRIGKHGIGVRKTRGIFYANLTHDKQQYNLPFSTAEEAARAVDQLAIHFYGTQAVTNFPLEDYSTEEVQAMAGRFKEHAAKKPLSRWWGVTIQRGHIRASLCWQHRTLFLGSFETERDAAISVDKARLYLFGAEAKHLNFPEMMSGHLKDPAALRAWFESVTINRERGLNYDKRINRYGAKVYRPDGLLGLGYYDDPVFAAKLRDMAVVHFGLDEPLNYPECLDQYRQECDDAVAKALAGKIHGKRA